MKFSAAKFKKDRRYRRLLDNKHLEALDGREVIDEQIDYEVDSKEFYIYPVVPEW